MSNYRTNLQQHLAKAMNSLQRGANNNTSPLVHFHLGTMSCIWGGVRWIRTWIPLIKTGKAPSFWVCRPAKQASQLTNNDSRSPVHLHDVRMDTFIGGIADDLGVPSHSLCHRVIHNRSKAPSLCLFKIFMIFHLKAGKTIVTPLKFPECYTAHKIWV